MPEFVIYKSEFAVRAENEQLKMQLEQVKADNARLRAIVGEPALVAAPIVALPTSGESFKTGNCAVTITPAANAPALNPVLAATRNQRNNRPQIPIAQQNAVGPAIGQQIESAENEVDNDPSVLRFSMVELK